MTREREFLLAIYRDIFRPRSRERIADWAARNITLERSEGGFGGLPYDVNRTPIIRSFFDWFQDGKINGVPYHTHITMKGSQDGRTLAAAVATAWKFATDPTNTAYVVDTDDRAKTIARQRFVPLLKQASPEIAADISLAGDAAITKRLRGAMFHALGPTHLNSWPISDIHLDECALHPKLPEGTTLALAGKRTEKQKDRRINAFSKPEKWPAYHASGKDGSLQLVSGETSIFTEDWMSGTQHVPLVPCPHCFGLQELDDKQLRSSQSLLPGIGPESEIDLHEVAATAWYECCHCAHPIYEKDKPAMVRAYELHPAPLDPKDARKRGFARPRMIASDPRNPDVTRYRRPTPGVFSIHTSDLYNIFSPECSFGKILVKRILAEKDPVAWELYHKDVLGLPPPQEKSVNAELTSRNLSRLCGAYKRLHILDPLTNQLRGRNGTEPDAPYHQLPCEPKRLTIQIDYQQGALGCAAYYPFVITAFNDKDQVFILDYGKFDSLDQIEDALTLEFQAPSGGIDRIKFGLMDSQHDTATVLDFCRRPGVYFRLWPSAGVSKLLEIDQRDLSAKYGVPFWVYNYRSVYWEAQLYRWFLAKWVSILDPANIGLLNTTGTARHAEICPRPYFPMDSCSEFYDQISNMHEVMADKRDPSKGLTWTKVHSGMPNDYGDMLKLALVCRRYYRSLENRTKDAA